MTYWILQILNGLSFGMLLWILAAGLSMIFGLMRIVNLAHGSFYLVGAYLGLTVMNATGSFVLAMITGGLVMALLGAVIHRWLLRRFQEEHLSQVLITFGLLFLLGDISLWIWGGTPQAISEPSYLSGTLKLGSFVYPEYRLAIIVFGLIIAALFWVLQKHTRFGTMIRASVDDAETANSVGINVPLLMTQVFALGAFLAGVNGVLGGAFLGVYPGADFEVLLLAFIVVIVGGLGSLKGSFISAILIGLLNNFGKALFPELSMFVLFAPMAVILAVKPTGLFGRS